VSPSPRGFFCWYRGVPASASLVALLSVIVAVASARADEPCAAVVSAERREADKQIKAGNAAAALARLGAVKERCFAKLEPGTQLWLLSDMAFAAHSAGDNDRCAELILAADDDAAAQSPKATRALLYNAGLCKPRADCDYKLDLEEPVCKMKLALETSERNGLTGFAATPCNVTKHKDAVQLGPGSCIEAAGFKKRGDDDIVCPSLYLVDANGKRRKLGFAKAGGGWIESPSDCCGVRQIKVKSEGGKVWVLIGSGELTRDCFGGTATTDYLTLFGLEGTTLAAERDFSISWH
jgi:hypothetical protein